MKDVLVNKRDRKTYKMKPYWFNKHCCVPECFNSSTEGEGCFKEYFDLPAESQARARWLNAILIEDGEDLRICEDHFKDEDVFRDKNNRKKLRVNSVPSAKLPKNICADCLAPKKQPDQSVDCEQTLCQCNSTSTALQPLQQLSPSGKRTRITWTMEEKRTLFRAIKKYGDVKVGNNNIRINWPNVVSHCRSNGCFGNEKELKSVWQNIRVNATKVYRNDIFGSKLERKVSRFLYGKPPKRGRIKTGSNSKSSSNQSTDEEDYEFNNKTYPPEEQGHNSAITQENNESLKTFAAMETDRIIQTNKTEEIEIIKDSSDEYYSISDVEEIFKIQIRSGTRKSPIEEVISLLSSDDEE